MSFDYSGRQPLDANRRNFLTALSYVDDVTPVPLLADPATGKLLVLSSETFIPGSYDYIAYTDTSTTVDTYTFKTGGASGTTVATVTITYTDTTKSQLSSVAKT